MEKAYTVVVEDKKILASICGGNDANLNLIEKYLNAQLVCRGNEISVLTENEQTGDKFKNLMDRLISSKELFSDNTIDFIKSVISTIDTRNNDFSEGVIHIHRGLRSVYPKNIHQLELINSIKKNDISFALGAAGTGKTYLAAACALNMVMLHQVKKIVLTRPVVEAGESLGFLPGDLVQKITPYLRPLYDVIEFLLPAGLVRQLEDAGMFEVAPLAYMRGRTMHNAVVILDEAQNTTKEQMKMFLTRMGEGSKMIITGDPSQSDIHSQNGSGLIHAAKILKNIKGIGIIEFSSEDVVRHSLVQKIIKAYDKE